MKNCKYQITITSGIGFFALSSSSAADRLFGGPRWLTGNEMKFIKQRMIACGFTKMNTKQKISPEHNWLLTLLFHFVFIFLDEI
jgi:hypothetical protein